MIDLFIPGRPVAKGRPRFNRKTGAVITPRTTRDFEKWIAMNARVNLGDFEPLGGPVHLRLEFLFPRPKAPPKSHVLHKHPGRAWLASRPDLSNIVKGVEDALNGIAYLDDSQIVSLVALKYYAAANEKAGTRVTITEVHRGI